MIFDTATVGLSCSSYQILELRSGAKKPPRPIDFNLNDPLHMEFVCSTARLRASVYDLAVPADIDTALIDGFLRHLEIPEFR